MGLVADRMDPTEEKESPEDDDASDALRMLKRGHIASVISGRLQQSPILDNVQSSGAYP